MRLIDADVLKEKIKNSDLTNHMKMALLSCVSSMPAVASLPNDPLTLDELRKMDRQPIWIVGVSSINDFKGHWDICCWEYMSGSSIYFPYCMESPSTNDYGITWTAYRWKLEHSKEV